MKHSILLSIFLYYSFASFSQISKEFEKLDSLNSYKDVELGCSVAEATKKMALIPIKESNGFQYSISNKIYLAIEDFTFFKGEAWFLFEKLKTISLESKHSDSKHFQAILDYFTRIFGIPQYKKKSYYWVGLNISYSLIRNTNNNHILVVISSMQE